jgi:hypothetical protein
MRPRKIRKARHNPRKNKRKDKRREGSEHERGTGVWPFPWLSPKMVYEKRMQGSVRNK